MAFWRQSIRVKLTLWYTLLVLSTILLFGGVSYYITKRTLSENLDISLRSEVRWVRDLVQQKAGKVKPSKRSIDAILMGKAQKQPRLNPAPEDTTGEEADEVWNEIFRHMLQSRKKSTSRYQTHMGLSCTGRTIWGWTASSCAIPSRCTRLRSPRDG